MSTLVGKDSKYSGGWRHCSVNECKINRRLFILRGYCAVYCVDLDLVIGKIVPADKLLQLVGICVSAIREDFIFSIY
jgi:uncharacterized membrane protein